MNRNCIMQALIIAVTVSFPAVAAQQAVPASGYPGREWLLLIFYAGTLALITLVFVLLYRALRSEEPDEVLVRMLGMFFVILIAAFSIAGGVQWLGRVSGIDGIVYQRAAGFLDSSLEQVQKEYVSLAALVSSAGLISSIDLKVVSFSKPLKPLLDFLDRLLDFVYLFLLSISFHKILLEFGHRYAMSTLFPLGVVLWVFPWTRKVGSILAAIALALWLVFPFSVIMILQPTAELVRQDTSPLYDLPLDPRIQALIDLFAEHDTADTAALLDLLRAWSAGGPVITPILVKEGLLRLVEAGFNWWAERFIVWLLVPLINLVFLMAMVSSIAEALGGEGTLFKKVARYIFPR